MSALDIIKAEIIAEVKSEARSQGVAEGKAEGVAEGKAEGKAQALIGVLRARGLRLDESALTRIAGTRDATLLDR